jgi:hypothetical protein
MVLALGMLQLATSAAAAEDCANTAQRLIQYLNQAESQDSSYKIKVAAGYYYLTGQKFEWNLSANTTIEGGYSQDCSQKVSEAADSTAIDAFGLNVGLILQSEENLEVDNITFVNGYSTQLGAGANRSLKITRSRFTKTLLLLHQQDGHLVMQNVLVDHALDDPQTRCSMATQLFGDNTVQMSFVSVDAAPGNDTCFETYDSGRNNVAIYDSIFWSSSGAASNIRYATYDWADGDAFNIVVTNSDFQAGVAAGLGHGSFFEVASAHVDPKWRDPANADYRLQEPPLPISPAINSGAPGAQIPGGLSATDMDIAGQPRVIGSAPDMGAYESTVDDSDFFLVTNTSDCLNPTNQPSCGSLRDAIARANAPTSTAPSKLIQFWIVNGANLPICPAIINVTSPLPDINSNVTIDGYSQGHSGQIDPPLSWPNSDPDVFNASLCVDIVGPGSGVGLNVPAGSNGSLTLRGVGMGNFDEGVVLDGGTYHQIAGNQFGGVTGNAVLDGFSLAAVLVNPPAASSSALIIGGDNVADRNVFVQASNQGGLFDAAAIWLGPNAEGAPDQCQIDGNLIGVVPDGTAVLANGYGLMLQGNGCLVTRNAIAGDTKDAIWITGQNYVVQGNALGILPANALPPFNGRAGIRISGSSNTIGAIPGEPTPPGVADIANRIANMPHEGIIVEAPGVENSLRGNTIVNSGALAIDLGGDGPTTNDVFDADTGPNRLQNYPVPHGFAWSAPPQPGQTNAATLHATLWGRYFLQPLWFTIDAYLGDGCDAAGRGIPAVWIGSYAMATPDDAVPIAFDMSVQIPEISGMVYPAVSLTATDVLDYNTSEIGTCMSIDTIFKDGLDM